MGLLQESRAVPNNDDDVPGAAASAAAAQPPMRQLTLQSYAAPQPPHPIPLPTQDNTTLLTSIREIILSLLSQVPSCGGNELRENCKSILGPVVNDAIYGSVVGELVVKKIIKFQTTPDGTLISLTPPPT
jgi:hypothetical protein